MKNIKEMEERRLLQNKKKRLAITKQDRRIAIATALNDERELEQLHGERIGLMSGELVW